VSEQQNPSRGDSAKRLLITVANVVVWTLVAVLGIAFVVLLVRVVWEAGR
jgi:hypothetical protein